MKKLLLGSAALALLAIAITIFQISCQKEVAAQTTTYTLPPATTTTLGGIIVGGGLSVNGSGVLSLNTTSGLLTQNNILLFTKRFPRTSFVYEIWKSDFNGNNQTKINISLPQGLSIEEEGRTPKLSPDGKVVFFDVLNSTGVNAYIYSCNIDGTNVKQIVDAGGGTIATQIAGAY